MALFDVKFFEKHQEAILFCANKPFLSWLLGMNRLPEALKGKFICKISPNAIHWVDHKNKKGIPTFRGAFFTSPRFAEALAFNLSPFVYVQGKRTSSFQFSPVGFLGMLLVALVPKFGFLGFIGTTTNYSVGTGCGYVGYSNASFSTARSAADGNATGNNPSSEDNYFQCYFFGGTYYMNREFYPTDTSGLTAGANISAASLNYYWAAATNVDGVGNVVVSTTQASTSTLANADYDQIGTTDFGRKAWSSHTGSAMNLIDLNASGIAAISKTGTTKIGIINTRDFDNSAPTGNNYSATRFQAYTGSGSDPYIAVTYTLGVFVPNLFVRRAIQRAATW